MNAAVDQEELELFRDNVRRFVTEEIAVHYEEWERAEKMPREVWNQLGDAGLLCVDVPEAYGGAGVPVDYSAVVLEELTRAGCTGLATQVAVHSDIVAHYFIGSGTEEQKQAYLPKMVSGECVGAIAMSEPAAGSDLQGIRTTAVADGDDYIINGSKIFITNGGHCDVAVVATKTDPKAKGSRGVSLFIVDSDLDGFSHGNSLEKIGQHASDTHEIFFDNVKVSASRLLGEFNKGFYVMMSELPRERWSLAVVGVAASETALQWTIDHVRERNAFGGKLSDLQAVRFRIAEMHSETVVHRAFLDQCTARLRTGDLDAASGSTAKLVCTELQGRVTDGCLQLFGGYGYMREYPIARAFTDARAQRIYGGASEIMKHIISQSLLGK